LVVITHLLDTDICIYALKARDFFLSQKLNQFRGKCAISDVTMFELYSGIDGYIYPEKRLDLILSFAARLQIIPFTTDIARIAGPLKYKLKSTGRMIGAYDILIAATALKNSLTLVTNNLKEYQRVEGLVVENWVSN
jgi:tRNA(fMet)-specific endonuclease VapC